MIFLFDKENKMVMVLYGIYRVCGFGYSVVRKGVLFREVMLVFLLLL